MIDKIDAIESANPSPSTWERTWAAIAHLSFFVVGLVIIFSFISPIIPLLIYLGFRKHSRYIAFQSMQAFIFQLIFWTAGFVGIILVTSFLTFNGVSADTQIVILIMLAILPTLAVWIYGIIGGVQTTRGKDFSYRLVGDWVRRISPN